MELIKMILMTMLVAIMCVASVVPRPASELPKLLVRAIAGIAS